MHTFYNHKNAKKRVSSQFPVPGQPISELFMKVMWRLSEGASSLVPARLSLPTPVTSL